MLIKYNIIKIGTMDSTNVEIGYVSRESKKFVILSSE